MLSYNQINDIFQTQLGRNATPEEYSKLSSASLNSLTNLQAMGYAPNTPTATPTNVSYDPTNPYTDPNVAAAAQNVANIGTQISAGRDLLNSIPQTIQSQATAGMGLSASQLAAQTRAAEAPITAKLKELGQQYSAAKSTYSATLSAAKQAISQAKSQVSREQSKVLTLAGKVIDLIKNRELDPTNPDTASYLSQIEQSSGGLLPKGFFASIKPPQTITQKTKTATIKSQTLTSGKLNIPKQDIGIGAQKLDASRGSDGYANTALYTKMLNHWTSNGGLIQDFIKYYPPKDYLNPNDPTIPNILRNYIKGSKVVF